MSVSLSLSESVGFELFMVAAVTFVVKTFVAFLWSQPFGGLSTFLKDPVFLPFVFSFSTKTWE